MAEERVESALKWRPIIAAMLSLIFAGLGHLYLRQYIRGVFLFGLAIFLWMTSDYSAKAMIFNVILFVFSAFDAFSFGKRGFGIL